jgi:hypothetical protein
MKQLAAHASSCLQGFGRPLSIPFRGSGQSQRTNSNRGKRKKKRVKDFACVGASLHASTAPRNVDTAVHARREEKTMGVT